MTSTSLGMRAPVEGLTVVGEAAHDVSPELIELSFEIHSAGLSAAIALQENASKAKHISQALANIGNAEADVKLGGVEVTPILHLPNPPLPMVPNPLLLQSAFVTAGVNPPLMTAVAENPNLIGYRAVSSVKVAVRNVNRTGEIVDTVTRVGAIPSGGVRFLLQDETAIERTLLDEAVRRAHEKATVLASAIGKTPGTPISISEEVTAYQPQQVYGDGRHNPLLMQAGGSSLRPPCINGQLTFCARVSVVYPLQ